MRNLWTSAALSALLFALNLLVSCAGKEEPVAVPAPPRAEVVAPNAVDIPTEMEIAYLQVPDRRFSQALAEMDKLLGDEVGSLEVSFREKRWHLVYKGEVLGSLDELPTFDALYALVLKQAKTNLAKLTLEPGNISEGAVLPGRAALDVLRSCDVEWSTSKNVATLKRAAEALTWLQVGLLDTMELSDLVASRTIATMALVEASGVEMPAERALLARLMGYEAAASTIAEKLDEDGLVRAYVNFDVRRVAELAEGQGAGGAETVLYLDLLRDNGMSEDYERVWDGLPVEMTSTLPILAIDCIRKRNPKKALLLLKGAVDAIRQTEGIVPVDEDSGALGEDGLLPMLEQETERLSALKGGPFLDFDLHATFYRAHLMTSIDALGWEMLVRLASIPSAEQFAKKLGKNESPLSGDFLRWYLDRIAATDRRLDLKDLSVSIREIGSFGAVPLFELYKETADRAGSGDLDAAAELAKRTDSRPEHRNIAVHLAWDTYDLSRMEKMLRSIAAEAPHGHLLRRIWLAQLDGDWEMLRDLLDDPTLSLFERSEALARLSTSEDVDDAFVRNEYERLAATAPNLWSPTRQYVKYLEKKEDWAKIEELTSQWLANDDHEGGLSVHIAITWLARAKRKLGKPAEGWADIEPILPGMFNGALMEGALLSGDLGEDERALKIAESSLKRYSNTLSVVVLARLYWSQGKYDEAAKTLFDAPRKLQNSEWTWDVGEVFVDVFKDNGKEGLKAYQVLVKKGMQSSAGVSLSQEIDRRGESALAFATSREFGLNNFQIVCKQYRYLKKAEGVDTAFEWMKTVVPGNIHPAMMLCGFEGNHPELLWELVEPGDDPVGENTWELRALAELKWRPEAREHQDELLEYYETHNNEFYDSLGAYAVGVKDLDTLWKSVRAPDQQVEAAFVAALKAQANGDYELAARWYCAIARLKLPREAESTWASNQLTTWRSKNMSLKRLAENRL